MRAVVQRVKRAAVWVEEDLVGVIDAGLAVLVGVGQDDSLQDVQYLSDKLVNLRVFEDNHGKMNRSVQDIRGGILLISQFTLWGDCRKGRRPAFTAAAPPEKAQYLYDLMIEQLSQYGVPVKQGLFGAQMQVEIFNDGPVTLLLDSKKEF